MSDKRAWVVFLTRIRNERDSYLPGIIVLAHSLRRANSKYPLVCALDPSIDVKARQVLVDAGVVLRDTEPLLPKGKVNIVAERFVDSEDCHVPLSDA
jgi:inositol 3-alpha-galactosyltransferase